MIYTAKTSLTVQVACGNRETSYYLSIAATPEDAVPKKGALNSSEWRIAMAVGSW